MDTELYRQCDSAFLTEIARTIQIVMRNHSDTEKAFDEKLFTDLVFAVSTHLSGSSFGGRIGESEIYPALSYVVGEGDGGKEVRGTSGMHESAGAIAERLIEEARVARTRH